MDKYLSKDFSFRFSIEPILSYNDKKKAENSVEIMHVEFTVINVTNERII